MRNMDFSRLSGVLAAAFAATVAFAPGASARTMARPGHPPPPMATAADDPARVAAARQFIVVYHPHTDPRDVAKRFDESRPRMIAMVKQQNPKGDAKKFVEERRAIILDQANKMLDLQSHVLSR